ncbi:MAG TPA: hypothetical protein VME66_01165 [Candidatus Acidoferrales bacterium]|nr:hypothetical protein [Candidatus Acidoferrales bacterium]
MPFRLAVCRMFPLALIFFAALAGVRPACAQSATPAPSGSPQPRGLQLNATASTTFIDQSTVGQGQVGPEAAGFIQGSPLSPNTPYDLFSSAPEVPGVAGIAEITSHEGYDFAHWDASLTTGFGYVRGSITNASYWGENLMPTLNPHLGFATLPYGITFPTHAGQDDGTGVRLSVLGGSLVSADGALTIRGGWFDLAQTDRFVFAQPALTNVNPAIAYAPAESLSNGLAGTDRWQSDASQLPLSGVDVVAKRGLATFEAASAALPALVGDTARLNIASLVVDHGEGTRFSAEVLHATQSGALINSTVPFGANPIYFQTPQGTLPVSTLGGEQQTIAGLRGAFHVLPALGLDGVAEIGRAWYDAASVVHPGTEQPGGYYHLGLVKKTGRATAFFDLLRMEPRYATMILPYGVPENQWSAAFAWPGQWLKSNYQLVDNSVLGVNRQGFRLRYFVDGGPFEIHLEYTDLHQIACETTESAEQAGFIDGYYLPQLPQYATLGTQQREAFWIAWHPSYGDLTLDVVNDTLSRPHALSQPQDQVSYDVPQAVLTYARHLSPAVEAATGLGRYGTKGTFSEPIDFSQRLFFAGVIVQEAPASSLLLSFRRTAFAGITTDPLSPLSPDFTGSALIAEQRVSL